MTKLTAISADDLPLDPDLRMVFEAKKEDLRWYVVRSDLTDKTDAGSIALLEWMHQNFVDLIYLPPRLRGYPLHWHGGLPKSTCH